MPSLIKAVSTCSGWATPVIFAVPGGQTPIDWKVRLCWEKVKYIDAESAKAVAEIGEARAPGALSRSETSCF